MSGGSYRYLFNEHFDELASYLRRTKEMASDLRGVATRDTHPGPDHSDEEIREAARDLANILERHAVHVEDHLMHLRDRHDAIKGLMRTVEWVKSGDYGPDSYVTKLEEWRETQP